MAIEVKVPPLGESVVEATVGNWLKNEGDPVAAGEPLVELETEKVNLELSAEQSGTLEKIEHRTGETVHVGERLGVLKEQRAAEQKMAEPAATPSPPSPTAPSPTAPAPAPEAKPGASAPTTAAAPSPDGGAAPSAAAATPNTETPNAATEPAPTSPSARRLAAEKGIDLGRVQGTGPGGRVGLPDVQAAAEQIAAQQIAAQQNAARAAAPEQAPAEPAPAAQAPAAPPPSAAPPAAPVQPSNRDEERVRLSRRRLTIARRLVEAQKTAAMLTTFNEVDMSAVMDLRKRRGESFQERHGVKLGFMSFFVRAVVGALKAFPQLNSELAGEELILKQYYDIGFAVGAEQGLVVPVVRDVDRKSFAQLEQEISDLARRARENSLTLEELMGGTFTITNGGIYGSLLSTPILNPPQTGILGMHRIQDRPVAAGGQVVVRPMMYLALSYDHRVVDGSEAVRFLARVAELAENPEELLLEG